MKLATYLYLAGMFLLLSCGQAEKLRELAGPEGASVEKKEKMDREIPAPGLEDDRDANGNQVGPLSLAPAITPVDSCAALKDYLVDMTLKEQELQARRVARQIEDSGGYDRVSDGAAPGAARAETSNEAAADGDGATSKSSTPEDFTTTNNQVDDVEESDYVKNTGTHIYQLAQGKLQVIKSWPAPEMAQIASLEFEETARPKTLLLPEADRLVVIGQVYQERDASENEAKGVADFPYYYNTVSHTRIWLVDVTEPAEPTIIESQDVPGTYSRIRSVGSKIYIVGAGSMGRPELKSLWSSVYTYRSAKPKTTVDRLEELAQAHQENIATIKGAELEAWFPHPKELDLDNCAGFFLPTTSTQLGLSHISSVDVETLAADHMMLMAQSGEIYASKESLYMATHYWWWDDLVMPNNYSIIHKFRLGNGEDAAYVGSVTVDGVPLNQFSMDEHEESFRIATTVTKYEKPEGETEPDFWWRRTWDTVSKVSVIQETEKGLEVVGETEELAEGERIYSVRFHGQRGFVVTFRQVDPLFTLDLSDPKDPQVVGELKITGFSNYMHMMGEHHLLTVGQEVDPETNRRTGLKISIFDVSDMANPQEAHKLVLSGSFWSDAAYDHKAFTYFASRGWLAIPVSGVAEGATGQNWYDRYENGLRVFSVDPTEGIAKLGQLDNSDIYQGPERPYYWWSGAARVQRSIFADDYLYAVSHLGVKAVRVDAIDDAVSKVAYECGDTCYNYWGYWW